MGGSVAKNTKDNIEQLLGETVTSKDNALEYKYNDKKLIEHDN